MKTASIRQEYQEYGSPEEFYTSGSQYENPHKEVIHKHIDNIASSLDLTGRVLDLGCGTGIASERLSFHGAKRITGCDPYLNKEYEKETGNSCARYNFKDIAQGRMYHLGHFSLVIASFSLHLCEKSMMTHLLFNLSQMSDKLVIISPHKKPEINQFWSLEEEHYFEKVRTRIFT